VRPNLGNAEEITAYLVDIRWDDEHSRLVFEEKSRPDTRHHQRGDIYVGYGTSFISLVTIDRGTVRLITVSQPDPENICRGIFLGFYNPRSTLLIPVSVPIVLRRLAESEVPQLGYLRSGMPGYESYRELINSVIDEGYVRIIAGMH
jgi:hypothetical protein